MVKYVLQDSLATKQRGRPVYLNKITGIGPAYTEDLDKAEKFDSADDARQSPAYVHAMCFFEPEAINFK